MSAAPDKRPCEDPSADSQGIANGFYDVSALLDLLSLAALRMNDDLCESLNANRVRDAFHAFDRSLRLISEIVSCQASAAADGRAWAPSDK
jgi:hypothetical protein